MDDRVAIQIARCNAAICGRIVWLRAARDTQGHWQVDRKNPDPALQRRRLCGLTILRGLRAEGTDHWGGGSLYNPDDGETYSVEADLRSDNMIVARVFSGVRLFGRTKILTRVVDATASAPC
jgi:uncharacterized protein (DUF2147 family)